jgi:hypothetical protein
MDTEVFIAVLGISLGAMFSGIGYFWKIRAERLRSKRNVLFYLLEISSLVRIASFDYKELTSSYFQYCDNFFKSKGIAEDQVSLREIHLLIEHHFRDIIKSVTPNLGKEFVDSFEEAVRNLSYDDPILAHLLRGRESVANFISVQNEYINNLLNSEAVSNLDAVITDTEDIVYDSKKLAVKELIKDINLDILLVSKECGFFVSRKCKKIVRNHMNARFDFESLGVDRILEDLLNKFVEKIKDPV